MLINWPSGIILPLGPLIALFFVPTGHALVKMSACHTMYMIDISSLTSCPAIAAMPTADRKDMVFPCLIHQRDILGPLPCGGGLGLLCAGETRGTESRLPPSLTLITKPPVTLHHALLYQ